MFLVVKRLNEILTTFELILFNVNAYVLAGINNDISSQFSSNSEASREIQQIKDDNSVDVFFNTLSFLESFHILDKSLSDINLQCI